MREGKKERMEDTDSSLEAALSIHSLTPLIAVKSFIFTCVLHRMGPLSPMSLSKISISYNSNFLLNIVYDIMPASSKMLTLTSSIYYWDEDE